MMKQKWTTLLALVLCAALLLPSVVMAGEVTPEFFLEMTEDAQEQYLENSGMSYEEAAGWSTDGGAELMDDGYVQCDICGGWYMNGNEFRNHICEPYDPWEYEPTDGGASLLDDGYVQCESCGGWYMNGIEFRSHYCDIFDPWEYESSSSSSMDDDYVQCTSCGGWYMNGNEFRNHFCTGHTSNPSSSWTSKDDYYDTLVSGSLNADTTVAIGNLYVNTANGKGLNMRSRPNTNGKILTTIPNGAAVTLFWYENNSWAYVAYRSYFGFCMTRHLSENQVSAPKPAAKPSTPASKVEDPKNMYNGFQHVSYEVAVRPSTSSGFLNMRWAPSKSADVQCIYYADTVLQVLATNGVWSQVYDVMTDQCGFIMNEYLNKYLY